MYAARFCALCNVHHSARDGDIWSESSMFGFLWKYFGCMDGGVYDITEWAACQHNSLKHMRADTHSVQYRIIFGGKQQIPEPTVSSSPPPQSRTQAPPSTPLFECVLNDLTLVQRLIYQCLPNTTLSVIYRNLIILIHL